MESIHISELFKKIKAYISKTSFDKETISTIVNTTTGLKLQPQAFSLKNTVLYVECKPVYRNEIFLKKEAIIQMIASQTGIVVSDIR